MKFPLIFSSINNISKTIIRTTHPYFIYLFAYYRDTQEPHRDKELYIFILICGLYRERKFFARTPSEFKGQQSGRVNGNNCRWPTRIERRRIDHGIYIGCRIKRRPPNCTTFHAPPPPHHRRSRPRRFNNIISHRGYRVLQHDSALYSS